MNNIRRSNTQIIYGKNCKHTNIKGVFVSCLNDNPTELYHNITVDNLADSRMPSLHNGLT